MCVARGPEKNIRKTLLWKVSFCIKKSMDEYKLWIVHKKRTNVLIFTVFLVVSLFFIDSKATKQARSLLHTITTSITCIVQSWCTVLWANQVPIEQRLIVLFPAFTKWHSIVEKYQGKHTQLIRKPPAFCLATLHPTATSTPTNSTKSQI